jgi:hypothetical protein
VPVACPHDDNHGADENATLPSCSSPVDDTTHFRGSARCTPTLVNVQYCRSVGRYLVRSIDREALPFSRASEGVARCSDGARFGDDARGTRFVPAVRLLFCDNVAAFASVGALPRGPFLVRPRLLQCERHTKPSVFMVSISKRSRMIKQRGPFVGAWICAHPLVRANLAVGFRVSRP